MDSQRQIGMRKRDVPVVKNKEEGDKTSRSRPKNDTTPKDTSKNVTGPKGKERKEDNPRSSDQGQTYFSLEAQIENIKIFVPPIELLKNTEYHYNISTVLNPPREVFSISYSLNLQDYSPTFLFGPRVEESIDEDTPPFYVSLNICYTKFLSPSCDKNIDIPTCPES